MKKSCYSPELFFENLLDSYFTGEGVNIIFFDNGNVDNAHFKKKPISLSDAHKNNESDHASRVSCICSGAEIIVEGKNVNLGIAPNARLFFAEYLDVFPDKYIDTVKHINRNYGRVHISAHAYSGKNAYYLNKVAQHQFDFLTYQDNVSHLVIAAAGHDGQHNIRFPACLASVLSVGIHDNNLYPAEFCGTDLASKKPELMVPDYAYISRLPNGDISNITGTSAAVGVVAGIAALWCEKLMGMGEKPHPILLKAVLIATGSVSSVDYARIARLSPDIAKSNALYYRRVLLNRNSAHIIDINLVLENSITVVLHPIKAKNSVIDSLNLEFELQVQSNDSLIIIKKSSPYFVCDIDTTYSKNLRLNLTILNNYSEGFLVITGLDNSSNVKTISNSHSKRKQPLTIVGVSGSHDASACVMQNGEIKSAIQLERITRIKRDGQGYLNSELAIKYCLETLGLTVKDVDYFAFNSQPLLPDYYGLSQPTHDKDFQIFNPFDKNSLFVSHHLAHAFSTFFSSSFEEAGVFVADGSGGATVGRDDLILFGDELCKYLKQDISEESALLHVESSYLFTKDKYELIDRSYAKSFNVRCGSSSLGEVYAAVSQFIFGDWQDGGKLMGLAPYGNSEDYGSSLLREDKDGLLKFISSWKNNHREAINKLDPLEHKNLAARIQHDLETALLQRFKLLKKKLYQIDNLAYAGGLALNCVANEKIILESGFKDIYIYPASNDAGISIGAAAAAHYHLTGKTSGTPMKHAFLGHAYEENDYSKAISLFKDFIQIQQISNNEIAANLAKGKIYGLFEGACEFGPRALGHRSIIADSRNKDVWKFINRWIKFREDFRPFAPAVPVEDAETFFEISTPSPYMLRAVKVREKYQKDLGAVTHLNGLARIQTVDKQILPRFHDILAGFGKITGYPILVNTSLNVRGQPLIETPEQAIEILLCTHLDGIIFENTLITTSFNYEDVLTESSMFTFAPDMLLKSEVSSCGKNLILETQYRKKNVKLEEWQYNLLCLLECKATLQKLKQLAIEMKINENIWLLWFKSLLRLRYIHQVTY